MNKSDIEKQNESLKEPKEIPLCLKCARPVAPLSHYCPNCGETTGQLTPYIPFVNLRMQVNFWVQSWHQVWSGRISWPGRVFRLLMIILLFPLMILAMPFMLWEKLKAKNR